MRTKFLLTALALIGLTNVAAAADLPARTYTKAPVMADPVYNWNGFYIGLNGGYGWQDSTGDLIANSGGIAIPGALAAGTIPFRLGVRPEGWLGGGQAGYNWQVGHVVFGIEGDLQATGIRQGVTISNPGVGGFLPTINTGFSKLDWFSTVRGRLGYAWNNVLLYGTAGGAVGGTGDSGTSQTVPAPPFGSGAVSSTRTGWAAGAGIEWGLTQNWTLKGEYLHVDLGSSNVTDSFLPGSADFVTYRYRHEYDMARFGFNYRFNGPVVAKY